MTDLVRQEIISAAHTIVIKVGTNVLTDATGQLNPTRFSALAQQIHNIRKTGRKVLLVSSGAVGAGVGRLMLGQRPADLRHLQACAAVGQSFLMRVYEDHFSEHEIPTAQILLTAGDFDSRTRYLNIRNTIFTLFEWNVLPIINENDTVSVEEIRFGDNDQLAAMVTNLIQAPLLVLLSVIDGLFTADPRIDPNAELLSLVESVDASVRGMASNSQSLLGTGGMRSKIRAAQLATAAGESVIMANGTLTDVLDQILACQRIGTLFLPQRSSMPAWKRWLGFTARSRGHVTVDVGAEKAIRDNGRSLLPIGVTAVHGEFDKGDVISIHNHNNQEIGRGLTNYSSNDVRQVAGLRTDQLAEILGGIVPYEELIHRDNLVITGA